jgi:hypothetical protein
MQKSPSLLGEGETLNGVKGGDEADFMQEYAPFGRVILRGCLANRSKAEISDDPPDVRTGPTKASGEKALHPPLSFQLTNIWISTPSLRK